MYKAPVENVAIKKFNNDTLSEEDDIVVVEEPLEIRLKYFENGNPIEKRISVTMRTPGNDFELAFGFLFTEGIIPSHNKVKHIRYCEQIKSDDEKDNVVIVELHEDFVPELEKLDRNFYMTSSCGVCGKTSIEAVQLTCKALPKGSINIDNQLISEIPDRVLKLQTIYQHTGGIHAAGLLTDSGDVLLTREDIGRHNAVDKVIGAALADDLSISNHILFVSGRAGFELVQKCGMAGIPAMVAVGAPSSLSVKLAKDLGIQLFGFTRDGKYNLYS